MSEQFMPRKIDLDADTTQIVDEVLNMCPAVCVKDRGRLCQRVSTIVARAEHAYKFGKPEYDILDLAAESAISVGDRCSGISIEDGRTQCGYNMGAQALEGTVVFPEWLKKNGNI